MLVVSCFMFPITLKYTVAPLNGRHAYIPFFVRARFFADDRSHYDLFGKRRPGDEEFRKAWQENVDEEDCLWTASEDEDEEKEDDTKMEREMKKVKKQAKENGNLIDGDDSDELRRPEYAELREGGPKKLNIQFFKDIQARMRDPNFNFSPELKLKPKSKLVPKKKWQKAQSRKRKNDKR
ncbi:hypothetical protein ZWY2020_060027 [Hordeum vulgare]|nr:hypothetical protein ZWY2020_060027 [Hordeum vulgare]